MVRLLVDHVEEDERGALWHLGQIEDPAAAPALRDANTHSDSRIRAAATLSLGWSGSGEDVPLAAAALVDDDAAIRRAARRTLAELGGQRAADALAISLDDSGADELAETVLALAWLRDRRALQRARRLAHEQLGEENYSLSPWTLPWALVRLGHNHDRVALTDATLQLARSTSIHPQSPGLLRARTALDQLHKALTAELPDEAQRLHEDLYDEDSERAAWVIGRRRPTLEPAAPALDPPRPDRVPRLALAKQLDPSPGGPAWPAPKFGGQPDWVDEPAWPLGHGGFPLVFYGQLPVLGEPERIAYIFVSLDPDALSNEPLGEGNAVVLRPGSPCRLPTASLASGPSLYEPVHDPNRVRRARLGPTNALHASRRARTRPNGAGSRIRLPVRITATGTRSEELRSSSRGRSTRPARVGGLPFSSRLAGRERSSATGPTATDSCTRTGQVPCCGSAIEPPSRALDSMLSWPAPRPWYSSPTSWSSARRARGQGAPIALDPDPRGPRAVPA